MGDWTVTADKDHEKTGDEKLSEELGVDVESVEALLQFRLDHARMVQGKTGQLGYIRMERAHHPDAIIVFGSVADANVAIDEHPLINGLAEEDCLECDVLTQPSIADLAGCEVILP